MRLWKKRFKFGTEKVRVLDIGRDSSGDVDARKFLVRLVFLCKFNQKVIDLLV